MLSVSLFVYFSVDCGEVFARERMRNSFIAFAVIILVLVRATDVHAQQPKPSAGAHTLESAHLINPEDLAKLLQSPKAEKPLVLMVGFRVLYAQGHIPGAEYIGPGSEERGIQALRKRVEALPRKRSIVIYCGCCPWVHCPNVEPSYKELKKMGYSNVRVLYFANNFGADWIAKGYPVEKGQ